MNATTLALLIASTAHAQVQTCTFEDLSEPNTASSSNNIVRASPIRNYEGFQFLSNLVIPTNDQAWQNFGGYWGYYAINDGVNFGGYDDGIIGDRALFTPYGSDAVNAFRISRENPWRFVGADITTAWETLDLTFTGYQNGSVNWTHTVTLQAMVRTRVEINDLNIDTLKISGFSPNSPINHFILDNLSYEVVPTPSALALLAVTGVVGRRRR
jgi:hypothetical protein